MIKVRARDGESSDQLIKRFLNHVKNRGLLKVFREGRYFAQKPTKNKQRAAAISREKYRAENKKRQFLGN